MGSYMYIQWITFVHIIYFNFMKLYEVIKSTDFPGAFLCTSAQSTEWPRRTWETQHSAWRFPNDWHCRDCRHCQKRLRNSKELPRWRFTMICTCDRKTNAPYTVAKWMHMKGPSQCPSESSTVSHPKGSINKVSHGGRIAGPWKGWTLQWRSTISVTQTWQTWWITEHETASTRMT